MIENTNDKNAYKTSTSFLTFHFSICITRVDSLHNLLSHTHWLTTKCTLGLWKLYGNAKTCTAYVVHALTNFWSVYVGTGKRGYRIGIV